MKPVLLFIDDDGIERNSCVKVLREIFADETVSVQAAAPLPSLAEYAELVGRGNVAAFIIDQRLNTSGDAPYSGVELASYLRSIGSRLPVVILTNYPKDDFSDRSWAVEYILQKRDTLHDPKGVAARDFKLRLLRQIASSSNVLAERERRFHDLLVKSFRERLSAEEESELRQLEGDRIAPVAASEREQHLKLDADIDMLKKLLKD